MAEVYGDTFDVEKVYKHELEENFNKPTRSNFVVQNISDPNQLFEYTTYNTLFTLSCMNPSELQTPKKFFEGAPHDIIMQSAGIGEKSVGDLDDNSWGIDAEVAKTLSQRQTKSLAKAQKMFNARRDLYFSDVRMHSIPGLNEKRRLTSVTNIEMEIVEPTGISLLEKLRAGASNNGYVDHIDAPYLLTIQFRGYDKFGNLMSKENQDLLKRVIPIKLVDMEINVNQAGSVYKVSAIPYNEFAFVNRYSYVRSSGTIPAKDTLGNTILELEKILNKQTEDESDVLLFEKGKEDKYKLVIDPFFKEQMVFGGKINEINMTPQNSDDAHHPGQHSVYKKTVAGEIQKGAHIITILENLMKTLTMYQDLGYDRWVAKVKTTLARAHERGGAKAVSDLAHDKTKEKEFYFNYFKIRASVVPNVSVWDKIRKEHPKVITFYIEPYGIHAYSLAIPGVTTGDNYKYFVHKQYNYIFTGDNVDILDLDIKYRVAYFQSRLKDVKPEQTGAGKIEEPAVTEVVTGSGQGGTLLYKSYVGVAKSGDAGIEKSGTTQLDQFVDYLTHPNADMVQIRLEIIGDPSWLGQSQFIPVSLQDENSSVAEDGNISYFRNGKDAIWNTKLRCYNPDVAEPIIMLNFRMPSDFDDKTGMYELKDDQSATFSGLYRVVGIENSFDGGKFTQVLEIVRFNNQGTKITPPTKVGYQKDKKGNVTTVTSDNAKFTELINAWKKRQKQLVERIENHPRANKKIINKLLKIR